MTMHFSEAPPPAILHRGLKDLPPSLITADFFTLPLEPGSEAVNADGVRVIGDGNEYGVYMTDSVNLVRSVYSNTLAGAGQAVPDVPQFTDRGVVQSRLRYPSAGVRYEIDTNGLAVRRPKIISGLELHYNNGFAGDEWIADVVPPTHYRVRALTLGGGTLNDKSVFEVGEDGLPGAIEEFHIVYGGSRARIDQIAEELRAMTPNRLSIGYYPDKLIRQHTDERRAHLAQLTD